MPVSRAGRQRLERRVNAPVDLAVIARRPGSGLHAAGRFAIAAALCAPVAYVVYRFTEHVLISLLPVTALAAARPRASTPAPSEVPLPFMIYVVVTGDSLVFATYDAGNHGAIGEEALRVSHRQVKTVTSGASAKQIVVGLADGRTVTVSVGRRRDRELLLERLMRMVGRPLAVWPAPSQPTS